eukprot:GSChrysophyteH1.ASY1.ANO1.2408.1 assembled CDS
MRQWGEPAYRAAQVRRHVYKKGAASFEDMNDLPRRLRLQLQQQYTLQSLTLVEEQVSRKDGTIKRAYELHDGQIIESVLMPYADGRYTACISSQAGCAMGGLVAGVDKEG